MAANRYRGYVLTDKGFSKLEKILEQNTESKRKWCTYIQKQLELKNKLLSSQTIRAFLKRTPTDQETITNIFEGLELEYKLGIDYEKYVDQSKNIADKCPYRGLSTFEIEDEHFFFGREKFINDLIERVETQPLVTVIGRSGIGKSSVVKAGLIPRLKKKHGNFKMTVLRPKNRPFYEFYKAILELFEPELKDTKLIEEAKINENKFKRGDLLLNEILEIKLKKNDSQTRFLIVMDQFEEIFTLVLSSEERNIFLKQLLEVINQQRKNKPEIVIVLTLRIDFVPKVYLHLGLGQALKDWNPDYLLGMNPTELRQAIVKPAESLRVNIQESLVREILHDVEKKKIELPLLELALEKLWGNRNIDGALTLEAYKKIGKIKEVIKQHANSVLRHLNPTEIKQAQHIFTQLVNFRDDSEPTRRLATKSEIGVKYWGLVDKLASLDNRLLVIDFDDKKNEETVEIVHESLINEWDTLKSWIDEDKKLRTWQQNLQPLIKQWQISNKDNDDLLRGSLLEEAQKWLDEEKERLNNDYIEFILDSLKYQEQENIERIRELLDSSRKDLLLKQELSALVLAVKAGVKLQKNIKEPSEDLKINVIERLQQATYEISEKNRFEGHESAVVGIAFNYDGQIIASASDDKTVKLWNIYGELVRTLPKHEYEVWGVCFSPDGKTIVSTGNNEIIKLWSIDGELIKTFKKHAGWVWGVSFSPDGQTIASASVDRTVKLWDLDGKSIRTFKKHEKRVWGVSFSPDGQTIASVSDDSIWIWSVDGSKETKISISSEDEEFHRISFSPDGKKIAIASAAKDIVIIDLDGATTPITLQGNTKRSCGVSFSPDGKIVASASDDMTIRLWSIDGSFVRVLGGHTQKVWSVSFSNDGKFLASASVDKTIRLWNLDSKTFLNTLLGHTETIKTISFSPDGKTLASAGDDKIIRLWDLNGHVLSQELRGHTKQIYSISFSPDGQFIASAGDDKTIRLWNLRDNIEIKVEEVHNGRIYGVSFSPDGKTLASASADSTIKLWDIDGNYLSTLTRVAKIFSGVSFSPDRKTIAASNADSEIILWSINGTVQKTLNRHENRVCSISFSPDSQMLASASDDKTVMLWNLNGDTDPKIFTGHDARVCSVSFSPDGKMLASASEDQTIKLWNLDGKCLRTLVGHTEQILAVSFSPDGKIIASAGEDKTVRLWTVEPDDLVDMDINSKLDKLLQRGRNWIKDYIKTNPNVRENDKHLCDDDLD